MELVTLRNCRVLVVDDDRVMRRLIVRWLERAGYAVEEADDGQEAIEAVEARCPDFVVTDWDMPHLDGLALCRGIRQLRLPHYVYILFLSGKSAPEERVEGLEVGADDFLAKPVSQAELLARMRAGSRIVELERRLTRLADVDPLTGLSTRRAFFLAAEEEWRRTKRYHRPLSCVMVDIDYFKRINDLHGHAVGDAVLKAVAELLRSGCRSSDLLCRYGGEEFCALLPETRDEEAAAWSERLRQRLKATGFAAGNGSLPVACSFGVAQSHDDTATWEDLIDQADQALLCAKRSGRDRVVRFDWLGESGELEIESGEIQDRLFQGVVARDIMTPVVVCLRDDETAGQAAEFFLLSRINSAPVVNAQGQLAGILSDKDLMAALVSLECWSRPIRELMKPNVICYEETSPVRMIYDFLCRVSIRRVVVVDRGCPVGTISRGTLLRWFRNLVLSKGALDQGLPCGPHGEIDPFRSKERLAQTAGELAEQVSNLYWHLNRDGDDLVSHVVGGATRMQELVDDLLAYSRYAGAGTELQSIFLDAGPAD
jgi:diguanylate cyclase (GGDEF)-like protein